MFKKTERLSRAAFTQYFKTGRRFQSPNLTLVCTLNVPFQVSAVVGKKVSKQAVGRNRIRRRLYAAMRRLKDGTEGMTGVYIFIAKPTSNKLSRTELALEVEKLLTLAYQQKSR